MLNTNSGVFNSITSHTSLSGEQPNVVGQSVDAVRTDLPSAIDVDLPASVKVNTITNPAAAEPTLIKFFTYADLMTLDTKVSVKPAVG